MFVGASAPTNGARVESNVGFSALSAVEPSLERHCSAATSSSRTRVPAAPQRLAELNSSRSGGRSAPCGMTLNSRPVRPQIWETK